MSTSPTKVELEPIEHPELIPTAPTVTGGPGVGVIASSTGVIIHDMSRRRPRVIQRTPAPENPLRWMMYACRIATDDTISVNGGRVHYVDKHPSTQDWVRRHFDIADSDLAFSSPNGFVFLKVPVEIAAGPSDGSNGIWSIEGTDYLWNLNRTTQFVKPTLTTPAPVFEFLTSEPNYAVITGMQYFLLARVVSGSIQQKHVGAIHLPQWAETNVGSFTVV